MAQHRDTKRVLDYLVIHAGKMKPLDMSEELGVSISFLRNVACKHGVSIKMMSKVEMDKQIDEMILQDGLKKSASEIAKNLNVKEQAVRYRARKLGIILKAPNKKSRHFKNKNLYHQMQDRMYAMLFSF